MKRYTHVYSLTLADIDGEKRMTPGAVLCYFQDTIARFLAENRVGAFDLMEEAGITWMIAEFHSELDRLPAWPGIAQVEVFLSELSNVKVYVDYLMRDDRGNLFARGSSTWLMVDVASRRILPHQSIPRFAALMYDAQNHVAHRRYAFPSPDLEAESCGAMDAPENIHIVSASETDFNGHMSNRDYVRLAMAFLQPLAPGGASIRALHVKFLQECHKGEKLQCCCGRDGDQISAVLLRAGKIPVCQLVTIWQA